MTRPASGTSHADPCTEVNSQHPSEYGELFFFFARSNDVAAIVCCVTRYIIAVSNHCEIVKFKIRMYVVLINCVMVIHYYDYKEHTY